MLPDSRKYVFPFLALAMLALVTALWAGLLRMGWSLPAGQGSLSQSHGALMVSGFLGTLITLERVVALKRRWMLLAPGMCGLGWVLYLALPATPLGALFLTLGSLGAVGILAEIVRRERQVFTLTMAAGALAWFLGNALWLSGRPFFEVVFWWQAFLVLTIAGERLELGRVLRPSLTRYRLFTLSAVVYLTGVVITPFSLSSGVRISGAGMLALAAWFLRNDIAARNIRHRLPLTRFIAICLFSGFVWLAVGGGLNLYFGALYAGPVYDIALHSVFVGFVLSMIFGHAPIIFPAILRLPVHYNPTFYLPLGLLHASLVIRAVGALGGLHPVRMWGGMLNALAVVIFLGMVLASVVQSRRRGD